MQSYIQMCEQQKKISIPQSISGVLEWDQSCLMPQDGTNYRATQLAYLAKLVHEMKASDEYMEIITKAKQDCSLLAPDDIRKVHVQKTEESVLRQRNMSSDLVERIAIAQAKGQQSWSKAKQDSNFSHFSQDLEILIELAKEKAESWREGDQPLYDVLLNVFDPGVTSNFLKDLLLPLSSKLSHLTNQCKATEPDPFANGLFPIQGQSFLASKLAEEIGFSKNCGVLFTSSHPFSATLGLGDYRITTRYNENDFVSSFLGVGHEVGHSLYEQGLPAEHFGLTIGEAASYGVHESQSLFWEKRVCTARPFLKRWLPKFKEHLNLPAEFTLDHLYNMFNRVSPGLIRVDADEVTYCQHIMVRLKIEEALITSALDVKDLPEFWNQQYKDHLGLVPENDQVGCLQDIHWAFGELGYFPSYALGHLISAQITEKLESDLKPLDDLLEENKLSEILLWLRKNVHSKGASLKPLELVKHVTGKDLSIDPFTNYLETKYKGSD